MCCSYRLYQYGDQCSWLRNSKFLRELENDNVDSEIVSEELRCFQEEQPLRLAARADGNAENAGQEIAKRENAKNESLE